LIYGEILFDAYGVAIDLDPLLKKIDYYQQNNNIGETILRTKMVRWHF